MSKTLNNKVLDDLNWHILEQLQTDGRMPAVEIGRRVGLSAPAVADRIQKLEDLGYIKGYQTLLDLDKLGLTIRAMVSYKNTRLKHSELIQLISSIPEVLEWYTVTGNYSVLLKLANLFQPASGSPHRKIRRVRRDQYIPDPRAKSRS